MDFLITLCDTEDSQACPDFGDKVVTGVWSLPDPAKFDGSNIERTALLNELYAGLYRRIMIFINLPFASLGPHGAEGPTRRNRRRRPVVHLRAQQPGG